MAYDAKHCWCLLTLLLMLSRQSQVIFATLAQKGKWRFCQLARKSSGSPFFFMNPGVISLYDNIASVWANGKLNNTMVTFKFLFIVLYRKKCCQSGADSREDYMFTPYS